MQAHQQLPSPSTRLLDGAKWFTALTALAHVDAFVELVDAFDGDTIEVWADRTHIHLSTDCAWRADACRRHGGLSLRTLGHLAATRSFCTNCATWDDTSLAELLAITNIAVTASHPSTVSVAGPPDVYSWAAGLLAAATPILEWRYVLNPIVDVVEHTLAATARACSAPLIDTVGWDTVLAGCPSGVLHRALRHTVERAATVQDHSDLATLAEIAAHARPVGPLIPPSGSPLVDLVDTSVSWQWFDLPAGLAARLAATDATVVFHTRRLSDEHRRMIACFVNDGMSLLHAHQAAAMLAGAPTGEYAGSVVATLPSRSS